MLLNTPKQRLKQVEKTTAIIINSMRFTVPYIDIKTASKLLKFTDRGSSKCLNRMCEMKLLRKHKVKTKSNQNMDVFCATKHGREFMNGTWRFKTWTMKSWRMANHNHDMLLHVLNADLQSFAFNRNYQDIKPVQNKATRYQRRADFVLDINKSIYQIELELTRKSSTRYEDILKRCHRNSSDKPFVWVFTDPKLLKKLHMLAQRKDSHESMEFVLWNSPDFKWVKGRETPLFKQHFKDDNLEIEGYINLEDTYDQHDIDSMIYQTRMEERKDHDKVMRMGFFEFRKYREEYLKHNQKTN